MKDSGRRWLIAAVGLFAFLLVGWALLALQLSSAMAGPLPYGPGLMSRLRADYRPDEGGRTVAVISLSILNEAMQALGLTEEEAAVVHESMELAMSQPVPTATAMDFEGAAPYTPTPAATATPMPTDGPTDDPENTRRPPTATRAPTSTKKPTKTSGPEPTDEPGDDDEAPELDFAGATWGPAPGDLPGCEVTFSMDNLHVTDSSPSSGMDFVGFKYRIPEYIDDLTLGPAFDKDSGGWDGDSWDATYSGSLTIEVYPGWCGEDSEDDIEIELWVKAYDNEGNEKVVWLGDYTIDDSCDDEPAPTATPTRTPTSSPTPEPTETPTT
jgi:hypothetical protein